MNWFWGFWEWLYHVIRFKDASDSVYSSKEITNTLWHDLGIEMCKILPFDTVINHL